VKKTNDLRKENIEFHPNRSSNFERAGKNLFTRRSHSWISRNSCLFDSFFVKNSYIELRKNPTVSSAADTTPPTVGRPRCYYKTLLFTVYRRTRMKH